METVVEGKEKHNKEYEKKPALSAAELLLSPLLTQLRPTPVWLASHAPLGCIENKAQHLPEQ